MSANTERAGATPGPWFAVNGNEVHDKLTQRDNDGARIGDTANRIVEIEYPYGDYDGQCANARLIAAAPDLLAACEASEQCIVDFFELYARGCSMIVLDQAVKSLRDDALRLTRLALKKAQEGASSTPPPAAFAESFGVADPFADGSETTK